MDGVLFHIHMRPGLRDKPLGLKGLQLDGSDKNRASRNVIHNVILALGEPVELAGRVDGEGQLAEVDVPVDALGEYLGIGADQ